MKEDLNGFMKGLFGFSVGPIVNAGIGFITVPITTWLISSEEFGKSSMYSMVAFFLLMFICLGIDESFTREYHLVKDKKNLFWNCFFMPFLLSILVGIIIILFKNNISLLLFGNKEIIIILILVISLPVNVIYRFAEILIRMEEKSILYSKIIITNKIINFIILIIMLLFFEKSFRSIILARFISEVIITIILFALTFEIWKYKFIFDKKLFITIIKYGLPLVPALLLAWVFHSMDKISLRIFSGFEELGIYTVALKFVMIVEILKSGFANFWTPTSQRWYANNVDTKYFDKVSHILFIVLIFMFSSIILFKDLIFLIVRSEYRVGNNVVPFLLFYPVMDLLLSTTSLGISFSRKSTYRILTTLVVAIINFIGNYLLVPSLGALGASISTGVSFIVYFIITTLISRKLWYNFSMKFYYINIALMLLLSTSSIIINSYILNVIIIILMILYNYRDIFEILNKSKEMFILLINKKNKNVI